MAAEPELLEAMDDAANHAPAVLGKLQDLYGLTDAQVGEPVGLSNTDVYARRKGRTKIKWPEIVGWARFFGVPVEVFSMPPGRALRVAVERDPDQRGPLGSGAGTNGPTDQ